MKIVTIGILLVSAQNVRAEAKCCVQEFPIRVTFGVSKLCDIISPLLNSLQNRSTAVGVAWNTLRACMMTICTGVGKRLHTLPSHPALGEPQGFS